MQPQLMMRVVDDADLAADWLIFADETRACLGIAVRRSVLDSHELSDELWSGIRALRDPARAA
jgi:hypothetical protein